MSIHPFLPRLVLVAVFLTTLSNGGAIWLKKVGWLNSEQHQLITKQSKQINESVQVAIEKYFTLTPEEKIQFLSDPTVVSLTAKVNENKQRISALKAHSNNFEKLSALGNDFFLVVFILFSLATLVKNNLRWNTYNLLRTNIPTQLLCLLVISMAIVSWLKFDILYSLAGLYSLVFLSVFLVGSWFVTPESIKLFARVLMVIIAIQLVLAPIELHQGISFYRRGDLLTNRITGTLQQPSTLGITAAIAFAFYSRYASQVYLWMSAIVAIVLIALCGSGTAFLIFATTGLIALIQKTSYKRGLLFWFLVAGALSIILLSSSLLWEFWVRSLGGRIEDYVWFFKLDDSFINLLFGSGLGNGTNMAIQIFSYLNLHSTDLFPILSSPDSTPLMLMMQIGIIGCALVYWVVLRAAWLDKDMRVVYAAFTVASLSTNVLEIFPLNFLLGLLLAKSFLLKNHLYQPNHTTTSP